jgi:ABC-type transport system involved in cytochrome bd biosynthesis fused ATPase/permease subunit
MLCRGRFLRKTVGTTAAEQLVVQTSKGNAAAPVPRPPHTGVRVYTCLLFGTQGSGKTSMLEALAGCKAPNDGESGNVHKAVRMLPATKTEPLTVRFHSCSGCVTHSCRFLP